MDLASTAPNNSTPKTEGPAEATLLTSLAKFHRFPLRKLRPETEVADADQYCLLVDWRSRPPLTACAALIANEKAPALWENRGLDGEIAGSWGLKVTLRPVIQRASKKSIWVP